MRKFYSGIKHIKDIDLNRFPLEESLSEQETSSEGSTNFRRARHERLHKDDTEDLNELDDNTHDLHRILFESEDMNSDQFSTFYEGDIIFVPNIYTDTAYTGNATTGHRVMILETDSSNYPYNYIGCVLSSQPHNSNKYNWKYPNSIFFDQYYPLMEEIIGRNEKNTSGLINVADKDLVKFTSLDLSDKGSLKAYVTDECFDFLAACYDAQFKYPRANQDKCLIKGKGTSEPPEWIK